MCDQGEDTPLFLFFYCMCILVMGTMRRVKMNGIIKASSFFMSLYVQGLVFNKTNSEGISATKAPSVTLTSNLWSTRKFRCDSKGGVEEECLFKGSSNDHYYCCLIWHWCINVIHLYAINVSICLGFFAQTTCYLPAAGTDLIKFSRLKCIKGMTE